MAEAGSGKLSASARRRQRRKLNTGGNDINQRSVEQKREEAEKEPTLSTQKGTPVSSDVTATKNKKKEDKEGELKKKKEFIGNRWKAKRILAVQGASDSESDPLSDSEIDSIFDEQPKEIKKKPQPKSADTSRKRKRDAVADLNSTPEILPVMLLSRAISFPSSVSSTPVSSSSASTSLLQPDSMVESPPPGCFKIFVGNVSWKVDKVCANRTHSLEFLVLIRLLCVRSSLRSFFQNVEMYGMFELRETQGQKRTEGSPM